MKQRQRGVQAKLPQKSFPGFLDIESLRSLVPAYQPPTYHSFNPEQSDEFSLVASNRAKWSELKQKENPAQFNQKEDNEQMANELGLTVEGLEALGKTIVAGEAAADTEAYMKAFSMFDIDKNGTIDSSELPAVLDYLKEDIPESDMDTLVSQADLDGDGNIDYSEFVELMKAYKRLQAVAQSMKAQRGHRALVTNTRVQTTNAISGNAPPLPPLRVPRNVQSRRHMRQTHRLRGRRTPHVLKSGSAGTNIGALRRELLRTKGLVKNLDLEVKKGVQWVQQHCPVTNIRAQMYCKRWGMEKLNAQLIRLQNSRVSAAFHKWIDVTEMERCQELAEKYLRWKGSRLMIQIFQNYMFMKMNSAWNTWTSATRAMILQEKIHKAIIIEKMMRGFLARMRVRLIIRNKGAIPMQALWRGYVDRKYVKQLRWQKRRNEAALRIQLAYRDYIVKKFQKSATEARYRAWSVVNLQRVVRGHLARVRVRHIRRQRLELHATCIIQAWYRGCKARKYVRMVTLMREREKAATAIQTQWRAFRSRRLMDKLKAAISEDEKRKRAAAKEAARQRDAENKAKREAAAMQIQQAQRAKVARQEAQRRREQKAKDDAKKAEAEAQKAQEAAAKKIQASARGHAARKEVAKKKIEIQAQKSRDDAATKVQRMTRAKLAQKELARRKELERKAKEAIIKRKQNEAALRIQTQYRIYKGELAEHLRRNAEKAMKDAERRQAVLKLQSQMRAKRARGVAQRRRVQRNAATTLQSQFRGTIARNDMAKNHAAAVKIQATGRSKIARNDMAQRKQSTIKIQALARGTQSRRKGTRDALAALQRAKHKKRLRVATGIQSYFRGQLARKHVQVMRDKQKKERAMRVAEQKVQEMKERVAEAERAAQERKEKGALRIQGFFRGWKARSVKARLQRDLEAKLKLAETEAESKRLADEAKAEIQKEAINLDVAMFRDQMQLSKLKREEEERKNTLKQQHLEQKRKFEEDQAATKREMAALGIQVWYRDCRDRQAMKKEHAKAMLEMEAERQRALAEARVRAENLKQLAAEQRKKVEEMKKRNKANAIAEAAQLKKAKQQIVDLTFKNMQEDARKKQEAQQAELLKLQEEEKQLLKEEKQEKAAIWLQGVYRGSEAKKEVEALRKAHAEQLEVLRAKKNAEEELARLRKRQEREVAVMRIQKVYRSHKDWQAYQKRLRMHKRNLAYTKKLQKERNAASKIQKTFRGYRARRQLKEAVDRKRRLEKKRKEQMEALAVAQAKANQETQIATTVEHNTTSDTWVQYWDENAQSYYYFNQHTQETSWENPNDTAGTATDLSIDNGVYNDGGYDEYGYDANGNYDPAYGADATSYQDPNAYDPNAYYPNDAAYDASTGYQDPSYNNYDPNAYDPNAYDPNAYDNGNGEWGNEWAEYTDEESGKRYYYNSLTGETQWID